MNIYLSGLIGTGKTSIGKEITRRLRWPFFDVDQIMEKEAGKRIHDIVAEEGWVSYREKEYNISKRLSRKNHMSLPWPEERSGMNGTWTPSEAPA